MAVAFVAAAFGQGVTTSALSGFVTDKSGRAVAGAAVTVVHEPTGTKTEISTRPNGQYALSGLRPGGPYTVSVASSAGTDTRKDVYLALGEGTTIDFGFGAGDVVKLEKFVVEGERGTIFETDRMSTGSSFNSREVEQLPSVRRNVQEIAQLDPRITVMNLSQDGEMSAQGQNYRYNSFLVDNVQTNDVYGLNPNGFTSQRSPIPFEALQAVSADVITYDVRRAGYTGALINAVTKSGTNRFTGMVYGEYTDLNMRAKNPVTQARESFREKTFGGNVGGPIIPGKLFFFYNYDEFSRNTPPPTLSLTLNAAQLDQIVARARTFNYEPGDLSGPESIARQKTHLGRIDWNISAAHRLSLTYRRLRGGTPVFQFYGGTNTSFSNFWYDTSRRTDAYTAQLFSNWSPSLRTEVTISTNKYDGSAKNRGTPFPQVFIQGLNAVRVADGVAVTNGTIDLGTYSVQQQNVLRNKSRNGSVNVEYSLGNHTIVGGGEVQETDIENDFITNAYGSYTFPTLASWLSGTGASKTQTVLAPGKAAEDAFAAFTYTTVGVYLQDIWKPHARLTLNGGIRFDSPYVDQAPTTIPTAATYSEAAFRTAFGRPSTTTNDGNYTLSPRVGMTYRFSTERRTQLRAGVGLFSGTNPGVWLANAYQNRGVTANVSTANATFSPSLNNSATSAPAFATINLTNPDFHTPAVWKGNIAIDHALPFGGLTLTAEASFLKTRYAVFLQNLNLRPVGTNPDGRIRYAGPIVASSTGNGRGANGNSYSSAASYQNAGFGDVYELTNTNGGGGNDFTLKISRPMKNNWAGSLAWTHSDFTEVSPMTALGVAQSFYNTRAVYNPNENVASTSNYNLAHRLVGQLTYRFNLIKKFRAPTTITALWQARSGRPYSWVFAGDANGDGFTFNDLLYVPSGPTDPRVRWNNATERDNFFAFVNSSHLNGYAGRVVPRNSERSLWVQTVDLKLTQTIPLYRTLEAEIFANLLNVGNLLNDKWGLVQELPFSYKRGTAGATFDAATNQYVYTFTPATLDNVPITTDGASANSRWQVQVGMRIRF